MNSFQKFSFDHLPCASLCEGSWNSVQTAIKQRHAPRSCGAQSLVGHFIFQRRWPRPGNRRWPALCAEGNGRPRAGWRPPHSRVRLFPGSLLALCPSMSLTPLILIAHLTRRLVLPPGPLVSERTRICLFCSLVNPSARTSAHYVVDVQSIFFEWSRVWRTFCLLSGCLQTSPNSLKNFFEFIWKYFETLNKLKKCLLQRMPEYSLSRGTYYF